MGGRGRGRWGRGSPGPREKPAGRPACPPHWRRCLHRSPEGPWAEMCGAAKLCVCKGPRTKKSNPWHRGGGAPAPPDPPWPPGLPARDSGEANFPPLAGNSAPQPPGPVGPESRAGRPGARGPWGSGGSRRPPRCHGFDFLSIDGIDFLSIDETLLSMILNATPDSNSTLPKSTGCQN